jgi:hypothetical protein
MMKVFWWLMSFKLVNWLVLHLPIPIFLGRYAELTMKEDKYDYMLLQEYIRIQKYKADMQKEEEWQSEPHPTMLEH